jgi:hypothetical protein
MSAGNPPLADGPESTFAKHQQKRRSLRIPAESQLHQISGSEVFVLKLVRPVHLIGYDRVVRRIAIERRGDSMRKNPAERPVVGGSRSGSCDGVDLRDFTQISYQND